MIRPTVSPLLTDLYQLTMMQAYLDAGLTETAVFEFFCRTLPRRRRFLLAAGLAQAVDYLMTLRFSDDDLAWARASGRFSQRLLDYLAALRFEGDVDAVAEGTVVFADEPILRVTAPLPVAQLVETRLVNLLHFQTLIASKAARIVLAAPGKTLIDFGLRRAHGGEAGLLAARAAYLAGFAGTATVAAAPAFGIPIYGTMAHAFVQAHDREEDAFVAFSRTWPDNPVLLIDTYDTEAAAAKVVALAPHLSARGIRIAGVRLDSGDLGAHARAVRRILDGGGLTAVKIFVSGSLDEDRIAGLLADGAPIDGFGVGTALTTSQDVPALDCAYKLQEYAGLARRKHSEGKTTWPGRKQVYRQFGLDGRMRADRLTVATDPQEGTPLLAPVVRAGRLVRALPTLDDSRAHAADQLARLPESHRALTGEIPYPVAVCPALAALADETDRRLGIDIAARVRSRR